VFLHRRQQERQDGYGTWHRRDFRHGNDRSDQLSAQRIRPFSGRARLDRSGIRVGGGQRDRPELSEFHRIHRRDRLVRAARRDGRREIRSGAV